MKKALLMFLILLTNIVSTNAQEVPASCFDWEEIVCNEFDNNNNKKKDKPRSVIYVPQLYQSEEYIRVRSEYVDYDKAHIIITNMQGVVVKDEYIQIVAKGENLCYIGDLDSGSYTIRLETDDFVLVGDLMKK